tara:strand:- start:773 stop:1162 length:390 start_codon:yes stop_codon:yes gene_type:complete
MKVFTKQTLKIQAAVMVGLMAGSEDALASANNFSDIARNINNSIEELPGLVTGLSYMMGLLFGTLGIMKIKDHVENPTQTPLKDGAVRLAAGGALFGLPIVFESMLNTIGTTNAGVEPAELNRVIFNVR